MPKLGGGYLFLYILYTPTEVLFHICLIFNKSNIKMKTLPKTYRFWFKKKVFFSLLSYRLAQQLNLI